MSLANFANIFKLDVSKGLFPYEKFCDIEELRSTTTWPKYNEFRSSLPSKRKSYIHQIDEILNLPMIYSFQTIGCLLADLQINLNLTEEQSRDSTIEHLSSQQKKDLDRQIYMDLKVYYEQKYIFERKINTGEYSSFLCHLKEYNGKDHKYVYILHFKQDIF